MVDSLLLGRLGLRLLLIEVEGVLIYFHAVAIDRVQLLAILQQRDFIFSRLDSQRKILALLVGLQRVLTAVVGVVPLDCRPGDGIALHIFGDSFDCARGLGEGGRNAQCRQHSDQYQHHRMLLHVLASKRLSIARFSIDDSFESMRKQIE